MIRHHLARAKNSHDVIARHPVQRVNAQNYPHPLHPSFISPISPPHTILVYTLMVYQCLITIYTSE